MLLCIFLQCQFYFKISTQTCMKLVLFDQTNVRWWKSNNEIPAWETFPQLVSLRLIRPLELNREKGSVKTRKGESSSWRERLDHMSTLELMYWAALLCQPTWYFYSTDWTYKRGSRDKMSLQDTEVRITCQTLDLSNECLLFQPQREQSFHWEQIKY